MRTILIDDEKKNLLNLQRLLEKYCADVVIVAEAANADEGVLKIREYNPDLIFLDIQMPGKNGFDMLKELSRYDFEIIFVTAFSQYGIQAIKFSAIDYLLKPINIEELKTAVDKAKQKISLKKVNDRLENLLEILHSSQNKSSHRIAIPSLKETRFVSVMEIVHCESNNSYTTLHLNSGEKIISSTSIYEYEQLLSDYNFIRCHQSYLVNKVFVKSFLKSDGPHLILSNGLNIPVSRQRKDTIKSLLT